MSSNPLLTIDIVVLLIYLALCVLASYRSFSVRRAMVTPLYRSRALWTGVVAVIGVFYGLIQIIVDSTALFGPFAGTVLLGPPLWGFFFFVVLTVAGTLVIFAWIDRTIEVSVDLDFLHRDSVSWKSLRRYAWVVVAIGALGSGVSNVWWEYVVFSTILGVPVAYSAIVLIVSGLKVRYAPMKAYMRWMGLLVLSLLLLLATAAISSYLNFPLALFSYFLYRTSTSLAETTTALVEVAK